jgi:hypothetical protein
VGDASEGNAHCAGVDYIAIVLVDRMRVIGGETRVFPADSRQGVRFTLAEPWSALLLDDARVVHETTPIQSATSETGLRPRVAAQFARVGPRYRSNQSSVSRTSWFCGRMP